MAKLHSNIKKSVEKTTFSRRLFGKKNFDKVFDQMHPGGTSMVDQRNAQKEMENETELMKAEAAAPPPPPMPIEDEAALRANKRREAGRRRRGRSSTVLGGSTETL